MKGGAHEPTAPVKPIVRGRGDTPPPAPPQELTRGSGVPREFEHEGRRWIARLAGKGAAGTGSYGLGLIDAIHFFAADEPSRPLREGLLPHGRFDLLYDAELAVLLDTATPIVLPK